MTFGRTIENHPDAGLIGVHGARQAVSTPALILDLDALDRNISRMAAHARGRGVALRPHGKTHKSVEIAKRQIAAGAIGLCAATLGEAEVFVRAGLSGVLLCAPVTLPEKIVRLAHASATARDFMAVVDHPDIAAELGDAIGAIDAPPLKLLVDIDLGMGRTGVGTVAAALDLARLLDEHPHLAFGGVQAYAGNLQHIEDYAERKARAAGMMRHLGEVVAALGAVGLQPAIVSGGGTGTHDLDPDFGLFTELQPGSYTVMDAHYNRVHLQAGGNAPAFETALFVATSVISANRAGHATTDAGLKRFATDSGPPVVARGAPPGATYRFMGDEYGRVELADPAAGLALGHRIECVSPHCDPTINLYDVYHVVRGDDLVALWPIDARGAD